jgi:hypothetical protein
MYAWARKETEARQTLDQVKKLSKTQFISPWAIGMIYTALGDKDEAFAWIDRAYEERNGWLPSLRVNPWLDPLLLMEPTPNNTSNPNANRIMFRSSTASKPP